MATDDWLAESLRLTLFPLSPIDAKEQSWWKDLMGEAPEQENYQPRVGVLQQLGEFKEQQLQLSVQPTRADWTLSRRLPPDEIDFPALGSFKQSLLGFSDLMSRWLHQAPPAERIAFGPILWRPADDRDAAYTQIAELIKLKIDFEGASDFVFQINRPRQSKSVPALTINRLATWSAMRLQRIHLRLSPGASYPVVNDKYACRVQLDINSAAEEGKILDPDASTKLFAELVELSIELATEGDSK